MIWERLLQHSVLVHFWFLWFFKLRSSDFIWDSDMYILQYKLMTNIFVQIVSAFYIGHNFFVFWPIFKIFIEKAKVHTLRKKYFFLIFEVTNFKILIGAKKVKISHLGERVWRTPIKFVPRPFLLTQKPISKHLLKENTVWKKVCF